MKPIIVVKNQKDWDALPESFEKETIIEIRSDSRVRVSKVPDNSVVIAYNSSDVCVYNNSRIRAYDSAEVYAHDNSVVKAYDDSVVRAFDDSVVLAYGNAEVYVWEDSIVHAYNKLRVEAHDNSRVHASDEVEVRAYGGVVHAFKDSKVYAYGNTLVSAYDNAEIKAYASSEVNTYDNSRVYDYRNSTAKAERWGSEEKDTLTITFTNETREQLESLQKHFDVPTLVDVIKLGITVLEVIKNTSSNQKSDRLGGIKRANIVYTCQFRPNNNSTFTLPKLRPLYHVSYFEPPQESEEE